MNIELKAYAEYKDSGQPWIGSVPKHWDVLPNRALFKERIEKNHPNQQMLSVTITKGVIEQRELLRASSKKDSSNDDKRNYKLVQPGDIVYNKMRAWQGAVGASRYRGIVSPAYIVQTLRGSDTPVFFHYLLRTPAFAKEAERWSYGITSDQWSLRSFDFRQIYCQRPPQPEQDSIARFLTHSDELTDKLIRAKRRIIELLREQKQAIVQRVLTHGFDPDVCFKSSGLEGLGPIPQHWEVRRVRTLVTSIDQGVSPQAEAGLANNRSWGVLKAGCVNGGVFREREHKKLSDGFQFDPAIVVREGDILVSRACGSPKLVGSVARVSPLQFQLILSDKTFRLNLLDPRLAEFLVAAMNTRYFRIQVERAISGAEGLANNLPLSSLKDLRIALPPAHEAPRIAEKLQRETAEIDRGISASVQTLDLVREYRTRLIADVVTGKLDVRDVGLSSKFELATEIEEPTDVTEDGLEGDEELVADGADDAAN